MISHWFGWLALGFCIVLMLKFAARKSHISSLNVFFRKLHIPIGVMLIVTGLLHGIIELIKTPSNIVLIITGIGAMVLILFIVATYIFRKRLKKKWVYFHRLGTIMLIPFIVLHLLLALTQL